jgi:hypothetical protein
MIDIIAYMGFTIVVCLFIACWGHSVNKHRDTSFWKDLKDGWLLILMLGTATAVIAFLGWSILHTIAKALS